MKDSMDERNGFVAYVGLDWGDKEHHYRLCDSQGRRESGQLKHSAESLKQWVDELKERFGGRPVALALEASRGAVVHGLMEAAFLVLYPIHPATSRRFRQAFSPSGAKDDGPDAQLLLELVLHHRDKLRPLVWEDVSTRRLDGLNQARRAAVDERTRLSNQLQSVLKEYFPQALELVGEELWRPLALDFLSKWPDLISLKAARPATLRSFYYRHNVRRPERVEQRLERIGQARALTTDEAIVSVGRMKVAQFVDQLRSLQKHIEGFEKEIAQAFKSHAEAYLFRDLPGAGPILAPRLLTLFGTARSRYPQAANVQKAFGIAPVKEKSGRQEWIHWRWHAPKFHRQSLVEWAGQTIKFSPWARAYYQKQLRQGKTHHVILRALAFKWIRILWKCWQTRTPYHEDRYFRALAQRGSEYALASTG